MKYKDLSKEAIETLSLFKIGNFKEFKENILAMDEIESSRLVSYMVDNISLNEIQDKLGGFLRDNFSGTLDTLKRSSMSY